MHTMPSLAMNGLTGAPRFRPQALFRPASVAVLDAGSEVGARVMANLLASGFSGAVLPVAETRSVQGVLAYPDIASLPLAPDLTVMCGTATPEIFSQLQAKNCFAAVAVQGGTGLRGLARSSGVRSLGPWSFGVAVPSIGLNATVGHLRPRVGRLALVSQSAALCRTVLDWAEPNGVGFSHLVGIGASDDIGFALVLDWLSRDPGTGAILLDIRRLKNGRAFLSAARAAARLRPVVAIRSGSRLEDPTGAADAVFEAALRRSGVLCVTRLEELLAAAETLTRSRPATGDTLAIVSNARGLGRMAADAALRNGVALAGEVIVAPATLAAEAMAIKGAGGVLVVHAPTGPGDAAIIAALAATATAAGTGTNPAPILVCALGETTGAVNRRLLAASGVPVFASPEQAVRGFVHLLQNRRDRAAARELPPSKVLDMTPDRAEVLQHCAAARKAGRLELTRDEALALLAQYGLPGSAGIGTLHIAVRDDAVFGPAIAVGLLGDSAEPVTGMPPLNLVLARGLVERPGMDADIEPLADALVRVSQMVVDCPELAELDVVLAPDGVAAARAVLRAPDAAPARLAIAPYPAELTQTLESKGEHLTIRPIRPEDAEAHRALFARLTPEDVRFRFFNMIRELAPEQMARLTQIDYDREMAFVVTREQPPQTVAVARLVRDVFGDGAEFAVVVQPDMKGRGVASALMRALIDWGRAQGLGTITGEVLADNAPMLAFMRHLGFGIGRIPDESDVVQATMRLSA